MAFQLKTTDAEARLYNRLDEIEQLKKSIAPELGRALEDRPAYEGSIEIQPDSDTFAIRYRPAGKEKSTRIEVKFPSTTATGIYKVMWIDTNGKQLDSHMVSRPDLVDVIVAYLDASAPL